MLSFTPIDEPHLVIESVVEDLTTKQRIFDEIEAAVRSEIPIASNTSALPISTLQRSRKHPGRFVGMHWAEPAHITRFLELIRGEQTSDEAFAAVALYFGVETVTHLDGDRSPALSLFESGSRLAAMFDGLFSHPR